jgi:hypothetical protein
MLTQMAEESGIETPTADDLVRIDRNRKGKKLSNEECVNRRGTFCMPIRGPDCLPFDSHTGLSLLFEVGVRPPHDGIRRMGR